MNPHPKHKFGRAPKKHDPRTFKFARYFKGSGLPPAPASVDWTRAVTLIGAPWGMMANDSIGDCTCAAAGHMEMTWTANTAGILIPQDTDIMSAYSAITGYDPTKTDADGNNPTDTGAAELDVLNYWRNTGIAGHKILAYVEIDPKNVEEVKAAIALFGGVYTGVTLTNPDMHAFDAGLPWAASIGTSIGGHAIPALGYDFFGVKFITWGAVQKASWHWFHQSVEECYAIVTQDWIAANGTAPSGFGLQQLLADLAALKT